MAGAQVGSTLVDIQFMNGGRRHLRHRGFVPPSAGEPMSVAGEFRNIG